MTKSERVKWLFRTLVLCLFVLFVLPSPRFMAFLGFTTGEMSGLCIIMGSFGSFITLLSSVS